VRRTIWFAFLLVPVLNAAPGRAEQAPPNTSAAVVLAQAPAPADLQALREQLDRLRREAEEARRLQEERIRALEQKIQELQKATPAAAPNAPNPITTRPGFKTRLYGFARTDVDVDTRKMFAGPHLPFWVLSPQDPRAANRTDGAFSIHPRLTRLGLDTEAPPVAKLGNAKLSGKIEVDFFNILPDRNSATSNSRQILRIRHAYGRLDWAHSYLLFGQTWDLISPLYPSANYDVVMWNAGNLADRRPQIRYVVEPKVGKGKASVGVMAGSPSAVDSQDLDADQIVDGEESRRPTLQARVALNQPSWVKGQTWEVGVWGHDAKYRINQSAAINGHRSFNSNAVGIDVRVPLTAKLLVQGEAFRGKAMADVRGGVGQNINPITGEEVHSSGGWAELMYQFSPLYSFGAGFTLDDPDDNQVVPFTGANQTAVGRTQNRSYYIVNRFNPGGGFVVGVDWMLFKTKFRGLAPGSSNRWNIWLQHNF
jgi:hypothetical protein